MQKFGRISKLIVTPILLLALLLGAAPPMHINVSAATVESRLSIDSSPWNPDAKAVSITKSIQSNVTWVAYSDSTSWLTVSPLQSTGNGNITISVTANTSGVSRSGVIRVNNHYDYYEIIVTQSSTITTLTIDDSTWNPTSAAATITRTITSNTSWRVWSETAGDWLTVSSASGSTNNGHVTTGSNNGSVTISAQANPNSAPRSGLIVIEGGAGHDRGLHYEFWVTQAGTTATVPVTIAWNYNGGAGSPAYSSLTPGSAFGTLPTPNARTGYTFSGWFTALTGGTQITSSSVVPNSATTYYAGWTASSPLTTKPSAPQNFTATPSNIGQIMLTWSPPLSDGGSSITSYQVSKDNGASWVTASGTNFHFFSGLANDTSYLLLVRAVNSLGAGAVTGPLTVGTPSAPLNLAATPDDGYVVLSWTVPSSDGGSAIKGYRIGEGNDVGFGAEPNATNYTITHLTNGESYTFFVRAYNALGEGTTATVVATPQKKVTVPSAPSGLRGTPGNGMVSLGWNTPDNGGAAIIGYQVSSDGAKTWVSVSGNNYLFTGLTNGTNYRFDVRAVNSVGYGEYTSLYATPNKAVAPSAPQNIKATPDNRQVTITWSAPISAGDNEINGYYISCDEQLPDNWWRLPSTTTFFSVTERLPANSNSYTFTNLKNYKTYIFSVSAYSSAGSGSPASINSEPQIPGAIVIRTEDELRTKLVGGSESAGKCYALANDIRLTNNWTPVDDFRGTLDGNGYFISNLNITGQRPRAGLFGTISYGTITIKNLGIHIGAKGVNAEEYTKLYAYAGGLIGLIEYVPTVTIENCYVSGGLVKSLDQHVGFGPTAYAGGLIGGVGNSAPDLVGLLRGDGDFPTVRVINSYTNVDVTAHAHLATTLFTDKTAFSGGLIGVKRAGSVDITNSYSVPLVLNKDGEALRRLNAYTTDVLNLNYVAEFGGLLLENAIVFIDGIATALQKTTRIVLNSIEYVITGVVPETSLYVDGVETILAVEDKDALGFLVMIMNKEISWLVENTKNIAQVGPLIGSDYYTSATRIHASCANVDFVEDGRMEFITMNNSAWRSKMKWDFNNTWGYIDGQNDGYPVLRVFGGKFN